MNTAKLRVAMTGGTGYVGGRLVPRLLASGYPVRCLVRKAQKLRSRHWSGHANLETREDDLYDVKRLTENLRGCQVGYFMVHSMIASGRDYDRIDQNLAENFCQAAEKAGLERIIYLGGLGEMNDQLSPHLKSRRDVENTLASGPVPVTVLRAAMVIGSGSASFEILRYLVERLPVMVTPRWVSTESQPISISDVLFYLEAVLTSPETSGQSIDIGGSDIITYRQLMNLVAETLQLRKRLVLPVPVLTPTLSSYWIHLVTPVGASVAQPLARGLSNRVVCRDRRATELMPHETLTAREAIESALRHESNNTVETCWMDAGPIPGDPDWSGGRVYTDERQAEVVADPEVLYEAIRVIGGGHGYYAADWLWRIRGVLDKLVGGPGLRRGRRDEREIGCGDALDFWRVLDAVQGRRLYLYAEMKLPGTATLEFVIESRPGTSGRCVLRQLARFRPRGLSGILYWFAVKPLHHFVFSGMLQGIKKQAEHLARPPGPGETG